jgi:hypothetical protein
MSSPEAMPDRRVQARLSVDQGFPAAPADPARDAPLSQALPGPRRRRARVRPCQGRLGACSAACPWTGSGQAARRPDDPRRARLRAQPNATSTGRGVAAPQNTGPAVDPVCLKGALPRRAGARVGVVPLSGPGLLAAGPASADPTPLKTATAAGNQTTNTITSSWPGALHRHRRRRGRQGPMPQRRALTRAGSLSWACSCVRDELEPRATA